MVQPEYELEQRRVVAIVRVGYFKNSMALIRNSGSEMKTLDVLRIVLCHQMDQRKICIHVDIHAFRRKVVVFHFVGNVVLVAIPHNFALMEQIQRVG